ncbi:MAG: hypothetical protein J7K59_00605 [Candidatus Korarchaeota archaeon]|nr:hypothetical protein [Candidatus Korarchaeota archaeon]
MSTEVLSYLYEYYVSLKKFTKNIILYVSKKINSRYMRLGFFPFLILTYIPAYALCILRSSKDWAKRVIDLLDEKIFNSLGTYIIIRKIKKFLTVYLKTLNFIFRKKFRSSLLQKFVFDELSSKLDLLSILNKLDSETIEILLVKESPAWLKSKYILPFIFKDKKVLYKYVKDWLNGRFKSCFPNLLLYFSIKYDNLALEEIIDKLVNDYPSYAIRLLERRDLRKRALQSLLNGIRKSPEKYQKIIEHSQQRMYNFAPAYLLEIWYYTKFNIDPKLLVKAINQAKEFNPEVYSEAIKYLRSNDFEILVSLIVEEKSDERLKTALKAILDDDLVLEEVLNQRNICAELYQLGISPERFYRFKRCHGILAEKKPCKFIELWSKYRGLSSINAMVHSILKCEGLPVGFNDAVELVISTIRNESAIEWIINKTEKLPNPQKRAIIYKILDKYGYSEKVFSLGVIDPILMDIFEPDYFLKLSKELHKAYLKNFPIKFLNTWMKAVQKNLVDPNLLFDTILRTKYYHALYQLNPIFLLEKLNMLPEEIKGEMLLRLIEKVGFDTVIKFAEPEVLFRYRETFQYICDRYPEIVINNTKYLQIWHKEIIEKHFPEDKIRHLNESIILNCDSSLILEWFAENREIVITLLKKFVFVDPNKFFYLAAKLDALEELPLSFWDRLAVSYPKDIFMSEKAPNASKILALAQLNDLPKKEVIKFVQEIINNDLKSLATCIVRLLTKYPYLIDELKLLRLGHFLTAAALLVKGILFTVEYKPELPKSESQYYQFVQNRDLTYRVSVDFPLIRKLTKKYGLAGYLSALQLIGVNHNLDENDILCACGIYKDPVNINYTIEVSKEPVYQGILYGILSNNILVTRKVRITKKFLLKLTEEKILLNPKPPQTRKICQKIEKINLKSDLLALL